jgi:hypothetical protein
MKVEDLLSSEQCEEIINNREELISIEAGFLRALAVPTAYCLVASSKWF